MSEIDFKFLVDLLTTSQEKSLIADLIEDPDDQAARNAYIDFLVENGRHDSAGLVSLGYIPTEMSFHKVRCPSIKFGSPNNFS